MQSGLFIDKTRSVEEMLDRSLGVCICGMPGLGKKTLLRMLLEKHPEVFPCLCTADELHAVPDGEREAKEAVWYFVRRLEAGDASAFAERLGSLFLSMPENDRVFIITNGEIPQELLKFVWNGAVSLVYPDTLWFSRAETYQYLRAHKSSLDKDFIYHFTRGWAGLLAVLVSIQQQMTEKWTPEDLYSRYEVRSFVQNEILDSLSEEERTLLCKYALLPRVNKELESILWDTQQPEVQERLIMRGVMRYDPRDGSWAVHPAIRRSVDIVLDSRTGKAALEWYEKKGMIREALECCWNMKDKQEFRDFLIRNYFHIGWMPYQVSDMLEEDDMNVPELFYLKWMDKYSAQEYMQLKRLTEIALERVEEAGADGPFARRWRGVFLNITFTSPDVTLMQWLKYLEMYSEPGDDIRIYNFLGESVSFLCGARDLTELIAMKPAEKSAYGALLKSRLEPNSRLAFRLARLEYAFLTDRLKSMMGELHSVFEEIRPESPWQLRMGKLNLFYLYAGKTRLSEEEQKFCERLAESLINDKNELCHYNGRALHYLIGARCGKKEDIIQWVKETGGDIAYKHSKTKRNLEIQIKVQMFIGNYARAGKLLDEFIPFLERHDLCTFRAEALFQKAIVEGSLGRKNEAVRYTAESVQAAEPYRYVRVYTCYGRKGREALEAYYSAVDAGESRMTHGKRRYKYGNVRNMPYMDWIDYIIRKAKKNESGSDLGRKSALDEIPAERLTVTEMMVLQYLSAGYSNKDIGVKMNVKLPTVKSHIYSIYKKLGVSSRIHAVQKGREEGLL